MELPLMVYMSVQETRDLIDQLNRDFDRKHLTSLQQWLTEFFKTAIDHEGGEQTDRRELAKAPQAQSRLLSFFRTSLPEQVTRSDRIVNLTLQPRPLRSSGRFRSEWEAEGRLVKVLLSDLRERLAVCRYRRCEQPFFLVLDPRHRYRNGTFCSQPSHQGAELQERKRETITETRIEFMQKEYPRLPRRYRDDAQKKDRLVTLVNERHCGEFGNVDVNFATMHWEEIQGKR